MTAETLLLPAHLPVNPGEQRTAVVLDVLRATTSMAAALAAGVAEIRIFGDLESARLAAQAHSGPHLLCGERNCLAPAGFDLGNSPGAFTSDHAGRTLFMSTTNGTRAIVAACHFPRIIIAALVNASAVAHQLHRYGDNVVLVCAGTNGRVAMEDALGAGAILAGLLELGKVELSDDPSRMALRLFKAARDDLRSALRESDGGRNVIGAGLEGDIDFASRLDAVPVVGMVRGDPLRVVAV